MIDKGFIVGGDHKSEWLIKWFLKNYRKYHDTPIVFADFGIEDVDYVKDNFDDYINLRDNIYPSKLGWFKKPLAIKNANIYNKVWLDLDIEICGNLDGIFDYLKPQKLTMAIDQPWTERTNSLWHNSGVVGCIFNPEILDKWIEACKTPGLNNGDQEILHVLTNDPLDKIVYFVDLPNKYNWMRLMDIDGYKCEEQILARHHTGYKGKNIIKDIMNNE